MEPTSSYHHHHSSDRPHHGHTLSHAHGYRRSCRAAYASPVATAHAIPTNRPYHLGRAAHSAGHSRHLGRAAHSACHSRYLGRTAHSARHSDHRPRQHRSPSALRAHTATRDTANRCAPRTRTRHD